MRNKRYSGHVTHFWLTERREGPTHQPLIYPFHVTNSGEVEVDLSAAMAGPTPPLGLVVGEIWWRDDGVMMFKIDDIFKDVVLRFTKQSYERR